MASVVVVNPGGAASTPINFITTVNQPPTVSITAPADGATFTAPANTTVTADASDNDGFVNQVEFFEGSNLLGIASGASYSVPWNNVLAGNYSLTARATDNLGATTTSGTIHVTVSASGASAPFITGTVLGTLRNDFNGFLGLKFTVGSNPITIKALGRIFISGNTGTHTVKLVNGSTGVDVPNGSISIAMPGGTHGVFKYVDLATPITLPSGTSWYLVSLETPGGDRWATSNTSVTTSPAGVCNGGILNNTGTWQLRLPANTCFVPVSFLY